MNNNTLLISYKTLCDNSELNTNIDAKIITPLIKEVQEIHVAPVLGGKLFEKIKAGLTAGNLTEAYSTLLYDYIQPVLIHGVLTDLPFKLNYRFTNTGVTTRTSENSQVPEYNDIQKLSDFYRAKRVYYSTKLSSYLCLNADSLPEFKETNDPGERPTKGQYDTGIYL